MSNNILNEELYLDPQSEITERSLTKTKNTVLDSSNAAGASALSVASDYCLGSDSNYKDTAYTLPFYTSISKTIETPYDTIWFKFTANNPEYHPNGDAHLYTFETYSSVGTCMQLYDSYQSAPLVVEADSDSNGGVRVEHSLQYGETYYIAILSYENAVGGFNILVSAMLPDSEEDNPPEQSCGCNSMENAKYLGLREAVTETISEAESEHWYKFIANAEGAHSNGNQGRYSIFVVTDAPLFGYIYNSNGTLITENESTDGADNFNFELTMMLNQGHTYYLRLSDRFSFIPEYTFHIDYYDESYAPDDAYSSTTDEEEGTAENNTPESIIADPVDAYSGAHTVKVDLMNLFGGKNLCLNATYNSSQRGNGDLGIGWTHNFEKFIVACDGGKRVYEKASVYRTYTVLNIGECTEYICSAGDRQGYVLTECADGYYLNCNGERTEYYNRAGQLAEIVDRNGFVTTLTCEGTTLQITDQLTGRSIYLAKNDAGKVERIYDENGRSVELTYEGNYLINICDVHGNSLFYAYDEQGRMKAGLDGKGTRYFYNIYDASGRVISQKDAVDNPATIFSYDGNVRNTTDRTGANSNRTFNNDGLLISYTDGEGNTKTYTYDERFNIASETDALGNTVLTEYNDFNKPSTKTDQNGNVTLYGYDTVGNLTTVTYPNGSCETFAYNSRNQLIRYTDLRGTVTIFTYDANGMPASKKVGSRNAIQYVYENGLLMRETDAKGNTTHYCYNTLGQMTCKTDAAGHTTCYRYDLLGHLLEAIDANGNSITYAYDCNYQKVLERDANGNETRYEYNGNLKPKKVTFPNGSTFVQNYDGEDRVAFTVDQNEGLIVYGYDKAGRKTSASYSYGAVISYEYDAVGNIVKEINPKEASVLRTFDPCGNVLTVTDADGNVTRHQYDCMGRVIRSVNATAGAILYEYSPAGDLLRETDALGNQKTYTYDAFGNRLTATDAMGNTTTFAYDANNNLISTTDPLGNTTTYQYNCLNQLVRTVDAKGQTVSFGYDALGRRISVTDARGNTLTTEYDPCGNVLSEYDAKDHRMRGLIYNEMNLPTSMTDAAGRTSNYEYDLQGNCVKTTDPLGQIKEMEYDYLRRNTKVIDPLNGSSTATYDMLGNVTALTGPLGGSTTYGYDSMGRMISESTPSGGQRAFTYNALNLREQLTNAKGQKHQFFYDAMGRITGHLSEEDAVSYTYDANGNILTVTAQNGTVSRTYDALNRVASYVDTFGKTIRYAYDSVGNLIRLTYPDETEVTYTYDANHNLLSVTDWAGRVTTYQYDVNNLLIGCVKPDGSVTTTTYDDAHRVISSVEKLTDETVISGFEYTYDELGRIVSEKDIAKNLQMCYTYDELSRVTKRTLLDLATEQSTEEQFAYDAAGNITGSGDTLCTYDSNNRLTAFAGSSLAYDAEGNLLKINGSLSNTPTDFSYDSSNRLISAGNLAYTYNAEDTRIRAINGNTESLYTYDTTARLSRLLTKTENGVITKYVYGMGLIGEETASAFTTYHFDYRGSTVAVTNSSGTILDTYQYDTYGKLISGGESFKTQFLYNGRDGVMTDLNGLCYMRARYYSPVLRRFINADIVAGSLSDAITLNRYAYANGNPVSNIDPFGLSSSETDEEFWRHIWEGMKNEDGTSSIYDNRRISYHRNDIFHDQLVVWDNYSDVSGFGFEFSLIRGGWEYDKLDLSLFDLINVSGSFAFNPKKLIFDFSFKISCYTPSISFMLGDYKITLSYDIGVVASLPFSKDDKKFRYNFITIERK